ncbi:MAG: Spy/CpxP family protein refolding chaperone [Gemmatimonadota bacterium]
MRRLVITSVVLSFWLVPAPTVAQGPDAAAPPIGRGPAAALLAARGPLGLTAEQVTRLEALAASQARAMPGNPGDMLRARADLLDAMKGEGDAAMLRKAMERMHQLRMDRALATLKARQEARTILTADQRAKADAFRANRRMRGGMRGGMRDGMRDGMRGSGRALGPGRGPGRGAGAWGGRAPRQTPPPDGVIGPRRQPPSDGAP